MQSSRDISKLSGLLSVQFRETHPHMAPLLPLTAGEQNLGYAVSLESLFVC
jgi:hypothetical protein